MDFAFHARKPYPNDTEQSMTAKLESLIKRELKLGQETYTVSMSPEGVKIALKGKRKGREISWETLLSGDAELNQQLKMSVDAYGGTDDE
jgi:hypothetical protein